MKYEKVAGLNAARLSELALNVRKRAEAALEACRRDGVVVLVTCGYRSPHEQARHYELGRTKPGPKVTNAAPGKSWHQWRVALDVVPMKLANGDEGLEYFPEWESMGWGVVGKRFDAAGFAWGADWRVFPERPHFQWGGLAMPVPLIGHTGYLEGLHPKNVETLRELGWLRHI